MPRRKTNKSDKIREAFAKLGHNARPAAVRADLAEKGVKVSYALVAAVKSKLTNGNGRTNGKANGVHVSVEDLQAAKAMADKLGSIEAAKHAIDTLAKLV